MTIESQATIQVFFSYSPKDQLLRDKLETQLSLLKREELILTWHDRKIEPGTEWADQIDIHLNQAQIILLLVSADFIDSDYCYNIEVKRAMERHSAGEAHVIPIILRPCNWRNTPFGKLDALPVNGKPITDRSWRNSDEAFFDVAEGIRKVVEELNTATQDFDDKQGEAMPQTSLGKLPLEQTSRRFIRPSNKNKIKQAYLDYIVLSNEALELTGIPANLFINAIALEEIFIPLEFRRARPLSDYPLTEEEIKWYRDELQKENMFLDYPQKKEEVAKYRELRKKRVPPEEIAKILLEAQSRSWQHLINGIDRVSISELWHQLTSQHPVAIIQGYPGMGKSTLLRRISLHMAHCMLNQPDTILIQELAKPLIPIILNLKDYAIEHKNFQGNDLSVLAYLQIILKQLSSVIDDIEEDFLNWLKNGQCLIMFDGLDEIVDPEIRQKIQSAIKDFILLQKASSRKLVTDFNRILITTRVAGHDQNAFYEYSQMHYVIAELTPKQIQGFLPRWCRNLVSASKQVGEQRAIITSESENIEKDINFAISTRREIRELAENPLLLTLLILMRQNNISLPRRRIELYSAITYMLLEDRNLVKGLPIIREEKAIRYLGPVAYQMQESRNLLIRKIDVETALRQVINREEGDTNHVANIAETFLDLVRKRSGLFVLRTNNYFGFCHRTFQEYFIARYILNEIKRDSKRWIPMFIQLARQTDDLWREPFLLALAYQSSEDGFMAQQIIYQLVGVSLVSNPEDIDRAHEQLVARSHDLITARRLPELLRFNPSEITHKPPSKTLLHDLLLAVECLIEAKFLTLNIALERKIVTELLWAYQETGNSLITDTISQWLKIQPEEGEQSNLVFILSEILKDSQNSILQCTALKVLFKIAHQLTECPSKVLNNLIPLLLTLADLPSISKYVPVSLQRKPDLDAINLAFAVLSSLGKKGPAELLLNDVRQYFNENPHHLKLLARYSLECGILLTPSVVPLEEENFLQYKKAVQRWIILRDHQQPGHLTEENLERCFNVHQELLNCAEEVIYPRCSFLLEMLQLSSEHPDCPWQEIWQGFLLNKMTSNNYLLRKDATLFWAAICPEDIAQKDLAGQISQFESNRNIIAYARECIDILKKYLQKHQSLEDLENWKYLNRTFNTTPNTSFMSERARDRIRRKNDPVYQMKEDIAEKTKNISLTRDRKWRKNDPMYQMKEDIAEKTKNISLTRDLRHLMYWQYYKMVKSS